LLKVKIQTFDFIPEYKTSGSVVETLEEMKLLGLDHGIRGLNFRNDKFIHKICVDCDIYSF
jgi:hypothetical protein